MNRRDRTARERLCTGFPCSGLPSALLLCALLFSFALPTGAQDPPEPPAPEAEDSPLEEAEVGSSTDDPPPPPRRRRGGRGRRGATPPTAPAPKEKEEDADEDEDRWFAVVGGTVHTVSGGVISGGTILVKNGRIHEVGTAVSVPPGAEVLEVEGHHVYPGLVAVDSTRIVSSPTDTDAYSFNLLLALAGGITTARNGGDILKLTYGTLEGHALAKAPFTTIRYTNRDPDGRRKLREAFERIQEFKRELARHAEAKKKDSSLKDLDRKWIRGLYSTAEQLIDRKRVAYANVIEANEIRDLCALAERFEFDLVIAGAQEGWLVAGEIARARARVIVTPRARRDPDRRRLTANGGSIENAAILHDHGVQIAIFPVGSMFAPGGGVSLSGLAGRDLLNLPLEAAFAVRGGLSDAAAVRAITLDAAKLLGVDDRIGSIEVGKDADFVITDGELLHYLSLPQYTIVNGRIAYDQDEVGLLDHIRPGGDPEPQAPPESWPRRLGAPF